MRFLTYIKLDGWTKYSTGQFSQRTDVRTLKRNNRDDSLRNNTDDPDFNFNE